MSEKIRHDRRRVVQFLTAASFAGVAASAVAGTPRCEHDGTPMQFVPKSAPDADPLRDEFARYPNCPYCGMDRAQWHHSRHLVHYDDDLADGTCSLHCLAVSLALNLDRGPKAIYAADFGSATTPRPLVQADAATYLIGSRLTGTMSRKSKMAFASAEAATAAQAEHGGEWGNFDDALREAYLDMAEDTKMIRKNRAERRRKMLEQSKG